MLKRLARIVTRHSFLVILGWAGFSALLWLVCPRWNDVTLDGDLAHLPKSMPSVRGEAIMNRAFPDSKSKSQIVLVVARKESPLAPEDYAVASRLADLFRVRQELPEAEGGMPILDIWTKDTEVVGEKLLSVDRHAALVVLQMRDEFMAVRNADFVNQVEIEFEKLRKTGLPEGLQLGMTGSAAIGGDMLQAAAESIANTETTAVALVILILLLVYRAPLLVIIPMTAIGFSVFVATNLVASLTQVNQIPGFEWWNFHIFKTTKIFVVVILYGAGTDYCLFLISRFKEELATGHSREEAVSRALEAVGGALSASAFTTIVGLGMMWFCDFGKFHYSGPAIGLCLVVALAACMTLAPAIMLAFGRFVFWPFSSIEGLRRSAASSDRSRVTRMWEWLSDRILAHPGLILIGSLIVMAPFAYVGTTSNNITYDLLSEMSPQRPSRKGTALLREHFPAGETGPLTLLVRRNSGRFETDKGEDSISRLNMRLNQFEGVTSVRSLAEPMGDKPGSVGLLSRRGRMRIMARSHPLTKAAFVTPVLDGRVARFDLVLDADPFSKKAIDRLEAIDTRLQEIRSAPDSPWRDCYFEFVGTTAALRDLKMVTSSDQTVIQRLVVIAVFAVLLVLLRKPAVCIYLILSVLWSYFVTMGIAELFFSWYYGPTYHGIDWKVPIYLFVILIAIGQDYNIYLATRIVEEQRRLGLREGLRHAIVCTGGIITSCGMIMVGTFVSMMTGALRGMLELGFALSLGVLLDTFLVRPIIVPCFFAILANRKRPDAASQVKTESTPHIQSSPSDRPKTETVK